MYPYCPVQGLCAMRPFSGPIDVKSLCVYLILPVCFYSSLLDLSAGEGAKGELTSC